MAENRWQDIFIFLKSKGYEVYSPGTKVGECVKPYIVVKKEGSSRFYDYSTEVDSYSVMCYVPKQEYSFLETMIMNVKREMKEMKPMIRYADSQTPSFYDDTVKAHTVSISYKNYKKM